MAIKKKASYEVRSTIFLPIYSLFQDNVSTLDTMRVTWKYSMMSYNELGILWKE